MGLFERSRIIAKPGWSRWLVPPAALAIHLSIGQAYAWSVFKSPLAKGLHLDPHWSGVLTALPFQLGIAVLGLSAAFGGKLVDHLGPRFAMFVATVAFSLGFLVSALGAETNQYWLIVVGYGLIGGIGLGIGYISPVSTLIKWFPDKPGMATGIAIMGFGGGALIATPWSTSMLAAFGSTNHGIAETFLVHGVVYAIFMSIGVLLVRVPAPGWRPAGWDPAKVAKKTLITTANVSATNAIKTKQFWLLWTVLCLNVTAGIGVLEVAKPLILNYFKGSATPVTEVAAGGFVALLSLANMSGRFAWSSLSDLVGRKNIYRFYLGVGIVGYLVLLFEAKNSVASFVVAAMLILSFYGGGFATIPAYLRDLFGTFEVGAIHGRLLTAWSLAGIAGPAIIDGIADAQTAAGKHGPDLYALSFYIMIGLLAIGFVANELIRPVDAKYHEPDTTAESGPTGSESAEPTTDAAATEESAADEAADAETADVEAKSEPAPAEAKADAAEPAESDAEPETVAAEAKSEPEPAEAEASTEATEAEEAKAKDVKADAEPSEPEAAEVTAEATTTEEAKADAADEAKPDDADKADAESAEAAETVAAEAKSEPETAEPKADDTESAASNGKVGVEQAVAVSTEKFAKAEAETVAEQAADESDAEPAAKPKTTRSRTTAATKTAARTTRSRTTKAAATATDAATDDEAPAKPTRSRTTRAKATDGTDAAPKATTRKTSTRSTTAAKTTRKTTAKAASNGATPAAEAEAGTTTETVEDTVN